MTRASQVVITEGTTGELLVSVLGENAHSQGFLVTFRVSGETWTEELGIICEPNGRLLQNGDHGSSLIWQSREGGLFYGVSHML